jgi:hypothetical protein
VKVDVEPGPGAPLALHFGRRPASDRRSALALVVGGASTLILGPMMGAHVLGVICGFMAIGAGFWMLGRGDPPFRDVAQLPLRVTVRGTTLVTEEGHLLVDAADVASGWIEPATPRSVAVLALRNGSHVALLVDEEETARSLLAAMGVDARATTMRLARGTAADRRGASCLLAALFVPALLFSLGYLIVLVLAIFVAVSDGDWSNVTAALSVGAGALPFVLLLVALADRLGETTLRIGRDGVWVDGGLFRRRFVAHVELEDATTHDTTLTLRTTRGSIRVRCGSPELAAAAEARITAARAGVGEGRHAAVESALARRGEPLERWRGRLRGVLDAAPGYRAAAIDADQLAAVLDDPDAAPELRVGAAVALASAPTPVTVERVRIAADAQAEPRLAALLARAGEGEVDEAALAEAEAAHAERRLRRAAR